MQHKECEVMSSTKKINFSCLSGNKQDTSDFSFLETAIFNAVTTYLEKTQDEKLKLKITYGDELKSASKGGGPTEREDEFSVESRMKQYVAQEPISTFDRLIVNDEVMADLLHAVNLFKYKNLIYDEWGLKANNPYPVVALNFFGPPGTGKTLAAHALADYLKKKIIIASYAQIESMYHGEGPKNVEAIFKAAESQDAVLFIDEADSLLSRRLTNVQQGSENAINSMRSQILICLEKFSGVVIFATNLVKNYDRAFESRVRSVEFALPDETRRCAIWRKHLPAAFPVASDATPEALAKIDDICGREIRNAVQSVAEKMAVEGIPKATLAMFSSAIDRIKKTRFKNSEAGVVKKVPMNEDEKEKLSGAYKKFAEENPNVSKATKESGQ